MGTTDFRLLFMIVTVLIVAPLILPAAAVAGAQGPASNGTALAGHAVSGLDLNDLEQRLRRSGAVGLLAKLTLKNRLDALIEDIADFHQGEGHESRKALKAKFDRLVADAVAMLRDEDPALSALVEQAHDGLWLAVTDPARFALMGRPPERKASRLPAREPL